MNSTLLTPRRKLVSLIVMIAAASAARAETIRVTGTNVTLIPGTAQSVSTYVSKTDSGTSKTGPTHTSAGTLGQFDPTLGVLTGAVATASVASVNPATDLIKGGGTGSATARTNWSLGGNSSGAVVINTAGAAGDAGWGSLTLTSSAGNLNNFVGAGNIATNSFASYISVQRSSGGAVYGHPGTSLTARKDLNYSESVTYTYKTHSNASFDSTINADAKTIDFGQVASNTSANRSFSIYGMVGGLGITSFTSSYLSGNDVFSVTGVNSVAAGSSGLYNAQFLGQVPSILTSYSGTYRLTFTDNVAGLTHASSSVGSNYIDLTMNATVSAVPEPEQYALMLAGLGFVGSITRRRKQKQ